MTTLTAQETGSCHGTLPQAPTSNMLILRISCQIKFPKNVSSHTEKKEEKLRESRIPAKNNYCWSFDHRQLHLLIDKRSSSNCHTYFLSLENTMKRHQGEHGERKGLIEKVEDKSTSSSLSQVCA